MNDNQKTTLDILTEMRKECGDADSRYLGKRIIHRMEDTRVMQYCDRLEAALKRDVKYALEHATHHAEAVAKGNCRDCIYNPRGENYEGGNPAALRDALKGIADICDGKTEQSPSEERLIIYNLAKAALAEPARNCDLPLVVDFPANNNADKAWRVFKQHNPDAYFDVSGLLRCIDWLLASATERKGDSDGK